MILELKSPVEAKIESSGVMTWQRGIVIGRTLERHPRYDVMLADGRMFGNLPADHVRLLADNPSPPPLDIRPFSIPHLGSVT